MQYYWIQKYSLYVTSLTDLFCITSVFFERLSGKKEIISLPESGQKANADTTPKTYRLIYRPTYLLCRDQEDSIFYCQKRLIFSLENRTRIVEDRFPYLHLSNSLNTTTNLKIHFSQIPYPIRFCRIKNSNKKKTL